MDVLSEVIQNGERWNIKLRNGIEFTLDGNENFKTLVRKHFNLLETDNITNEHVYSFVKQMIEQAVLKEVTSSWVD